MDTTRRWESFLSRFFGFDHGAGHPLLFLDDAKAPHGRNNNEFKDLGNYSEWPKVAGAVINADFLASIMASATPFCFCTTQKHLTVKRARSSKA